jgi:thymidylate synthase (FAD)
MDKIEVKVLRHNLDGMPLFLAKLTQRGHKISNMKDLEELYAECITKTPSERLMKLPHTTIQRMCTVTIAITGLSTKALTQLRTHAKRATCISTSTQYSSYEGREDNFVMPPNLSEQDKNHMIAAYTNVESYYKYLINQGIDKDLVGYLLPQGLRKAFIMHANINDWNYILSTRLCNRNTKEVQHICNLIYNAIAEIDPVWVSNALPKCVDGKCPEGNFCCGTKFNKGELDERIK